MHVARLAKGLGLSRKRNEAKEALFKIWLDVMTFSQVVGRANRHDEVRAVFQQYFKDLLARSDGL